MEYWYGDSGHERAACCSTLLSLWLTLNPIDEIHNQYWSQNFYYSCINELPYQKLNYVPLLSSEGAFEKSVFIVGISFDIELDSFFESFHCMLYLHVFRQFTELLKLQSLTHTAIKIGSV